MRIPIQATVNPVGRIKIVGFSSAPLLPGQTANFEFIFESTLDHEVSGTFSCTSTDQPFSSTRVPVTVPSRANVHVVLPVTCAPGTLSGRFDQVDFGFEPGDPAGNSGIEFSIEVLSARTVSVTTNLPRDLHLEPGSSTLCKVTVEDSGGFSDIKIGPGLLPDGINVEIGPTRTIAESGSGERRDEVDIASSLEAAIRKGSHTSTTQLASRCSAPTLAVPLTSLSAANIALTSSLATPTPEQAIRTGTRSPLRQTTIRSRKVFTCNL